LFSLAFLIEEGSFEPRKGTDVSAATFAETPQGDSWAEAAWRQND
jgi:hypothetical protein